MAFAIGELGLKPWEYYDMVPEEYNMYARGYFARTQTHQVPFRKLYQLLWNVNASKNRITSLSSLANHWPLPLIDKLSVGPITAQDQLATWNRLATKAKERIKHINEAGVRDSN